MASDGNKEGEQIHIGYSGSIHKVGGSLSIKNQLAVAEVVVREFVAWLNVHWRFIQIKGYILRVNSLKRCVNC